MRDGWLASSPPSLRGAKRRSNPESHAWLWIAHMGIECVKVVGQLFVRLQASSSSRPWGPGDGARRSSQGRPFRAAAKRLGLDLIEHAIRLLWSGAVWRIPPSVGDPWVRAVSTIWVCLPDQTHIRSSHTATAPRFRLRRAGSRGRGHSSLRRLKPCNPSVRPPGSAEADRASADWFCFWFSSGRVRCFGLRRSSSRPARSRRRGPHTSTTPPAACAPAPRWPSCGRVGYAL